MNKTREALEKLAKWRSVFAGWQLGTRGEDDPESRAVRDHREVTMFLRAEVSALTILLIEKGVFTAEEFDATLCHEAEVLDKSYEARFPGFSTDLAGVQMDLAKIKEAGTMEGWRP